jgi:hypothetical protein
VQVRGAGRTRGVGRGVGRRLGRRRLMRSVGGCLGDRWSRGGRWCRCRKRWRKWLASSSRSRSLSSLCDVCSEIRKSVPVTAAVIAPASTFPPPPFGEEKSMVSPSSMICLWPARKRKSALEPTRVIVKSGNSNSAREFPPVLSARSPEMTSPRTALVFRGKTETSLIVLVTPARS